jgi:hypothetical protein
VAADPTSHLALWTDLTRRAQPEVRAAPATLLAFTTWQAGEGAISTIALEVALAADPRYSAALLLNSVISEGTRPTEWGDGPVPPLPLRRIRRRRLPAREAT